MQWYSILCCESATGLWTTHRLAVMCACPSVTPLLGSGLSVRAMDHTDLLPCVHVHLWPKASPLLKPPLAHWWGGRGGGGGVAGAEVFYLRVCCTIFMILRTCTTHCWMRPRHLQTPVKKKIKNKKNTLIDIWSLFIGFWAVSQGYGPHTDLLSCVHVHLWPHYWVLGCQSGLWTTHRLAVMCACPSVTSLLGSGLSVTWAASANQNVANKIPHKKLIKCLPPCLAL